MKIQALALGLGLIGLSTAAQATPLYVGQNLNPSNNISLGITDTLTKKTDTVGRGNIAAFELKGNYEVMDRLSVGMNLPFYMANSKATRGESRTSLGNFALGATYADSLSSPADDLAWGYAVSLDAYMPTSRKAEAAFVATANPTVDLYRYNPKTTTGHAQAGLWIGNEMFRAKANAGYAFSNVSNATDPLSKSRSTFTMQTAATWQAMPNLAANLEYNSIILDSDTSGTGNKKFRHALTPSVSGSFDQILASGFVSIPLDTTTRDYQNIAFGANLGYMF